MKKIYFTGIAGLWSLLTIAQSPAKRNSDPTIDHLRKITDSTILQQKVDSLMATQEESNFISVMQFYAMQNNTAGAAKAAEISAAAVKKWPKGKLAAQAKAAVIMQEKDLAKKEAMYEKAVSEFGTRGFEFVAHDLAMNAAANGNKDKMLAYLEKAGFPDSWGLKGYMANMLVAKDPAGALPYLKVAVDSSRAGYEEELKAGDASNKNRLERARGNYYAYAGSYTRALIGTGKSQEAWQFIQPLYQSAEKKSTLAASYAEAAIAADKLALAFPVMEELIIEGMPSEQVKKHLKDAYTAAKGTSDGFDEYETSLDNRKVENLRKEVLAQAINVPAKAFSLKDVNGKTVSLASLKGKVVVLDFWATWCGPCKASFPIMQQAVNKYKNDAGVEFLFVHTLDKGDDNATQSAAKYVNDNKYTFHVLMDLRNKQTGRSAVSSDYGINAIPTKVVIDGNGNIRFQVTGFKSLDDRAVSELSAMIEYARKNS